MPENLRDAEQDAILAAETYAVDKAIAEASRLKRIQTPIEKDRRVNVENAAKRRRSRRAMANASRRKNR